MSLVYPIESIRKDFPILSETIYKHPLVYLDNGATTQKPQTVIQAMTDYYSHYNSNVHRGVHFLSQKATDGHEAARRSVQQFINAQYEHEVIFTRGTTDSVNILAYSFTKHYMQPGDEILISAMEHHSNIVPWQIACEDRGVQLNVIPMLVDGTLDLDYYKNALSNKKVKLVAVTWVSNSLGTINPVQELIELAHNQQIPVMLDAAQAIQHIPVDVQALDVDFLVFSGHKIYGPTGIGVLYGKEQFLKVMPPYQGGGSMIKTVTFKETTYTDLPFRFEAGTPSIAETIGLHAALDYVTNLGITNIADYEHGLMQYLLAELRKIELLQIIGDNNDKAGAVSFNIKGVHPFDIGEILDKLGIAVRTGHHCCQPIMDFYSIPGTIRVSLGLYNTKEEIDYFIFQLQKAITLFL